MISEKDFRQQVVDFARLTGWHCYFTWNSMHSPKGFPDLVLVRPPELLYVELKSDTGKLTAEQEECIDILRQAGQTVFVWRPSDDVWIERLLKGRCRTDA